MDEELRPGEPAEAESLADVVKESARPGAFAFPETRWTILQQAAGSNTVAGRALESICRDYWYPLYAFVRRQGQSEEDAQDLTQGFFEYLLHGEYLARVDRDKGRLRSYLLGAIKHYMIAEWRKASAQKRGGGEMPVSIDADEAEERFQAEPADDPSQTPDRLFERRWAMAILDSVVQKLESDYRDRGKGEQFEVLGPFLAWNSGESNYAEAGAKIGMKEGAVKVAVHRMRKRYGEILRDEIAQTVSSPEEIQEEIDFLLRALR